MVWKGIILSCLFVGFLLLFLQIHRKNIFRRLLKQTRENMDEATRQRLLQSRQTLLSLQEENSLWSRVESNLQYSGLKRRFPVLTAERWIAGNILLWALSVTMIMMLGGKWHVAIWIVGGGIGGESLAIMLLRGIEFRKVEQNLLKFLDFLGNYSITAGEVTGIFQQVSKYVEEPMKSVLSECYYEAQTTGDSGMALLSMAEKIEHPKFKELVRNMEISSRYCADFSLLVSSSRRSLREYLRMGGERKNMLREAAVNMLLLLAMSVVILVTVDGMVEASIWFLLWFTWPGRLAVAVLVFIFLLFAVQIYKNNG